MQQFDRNGTVGRDIVTIRGMGEARGMMRSALSRSTEMTEVTVSIQSVDHRSNERPSQLCRSRR